MSFLSQVFPPKPNFTEDEIPELAGKVFLVTGANTGLGKEIANILYAKNATTAQGYELQLGTNCLGHFLVARKLTPLLQSTARSAPEGSVRVLWVSSSAAEAGAPAEGVPLDNLDYHVDKTAMFKYGVSKAGNYFQATEFAKRYREDGIISVGMNPGNLRSSLARSSGLIFGQFHHLISYPPINGAYTELFAAFSPAVTNGSWVISLGRVGSVKKSLQDAAKDES